MTIKPLANRVLIELKKKETTTASGIVLPETMDKEKKAEGMVVAVGPGKLLESGQRSVMEVAVGQTVLVKSWGGDEIKFNDKEYKIFDAEEILAVVQE